MVRVFHNCGSSSTSPHLHLVPRVDVHPTPEPHNIYIRRRQWIRHLGNGFEDQRFECDWHLWNRRGDDYHNYHIEPSRAHIENCT